MNSLELSTYTMEVWSARAKAWGEPRYQGWCRKHISAHALLWPWPLQWQGSSSLPEGSPSAFALTCCGWNRISCVENGIGCSVFWEELYSLSCSPVLSLLFAFLEWQPQALVKRCMFKWKCHKYEHGRGNNCPLHLEQLYFYGNDSAPNICLFSGCSELRLW